MYLDLVNNEEFLQTHGLVDKQIKTLQDAGHKIEELCEALSKYEIPECLNHSDFHANNMLFDNNTKKISIIDLGETAINHPLFSLAAFLLISSNLYNVAFDSTNYRSLREACFNGWLDNEKSMIKVIELINILLPVYLLFAQKRFLDTIHLPYNANNPMSVRQHEKINKGFIWFIDNMKKNYGN